MLRKLLDKIAKKVAEKYDDESIFYWVTPKEKSGWIVFDIGWGEYACKCCGYITSSCNKPLPDYCPNCGRKMTFKSWE